MLLDSFIQLIVGAIDEKSPYTGGHCERVPKLTEMLAEAACQATTGPFRDFQLTAEEKYELHIAGWMHDCGKVTTPEYVVDKSTKLETIHDRIETVVTRFEILKRDAEIAYLKDLAAGGIARRGARPSIAPRSSGSTPTANSSNRPTSAASSWTMTRRTGCAASPP